MVVTPVQACRGFSPAALVARRISPHNLARSARVTWPSNLIPVRQVVDGRHIWCDRPAEVPAVKTSVSSVKSSAVQDVLTSSATQTRLLQPIPKSNVLQPSPCAPTRTLRPQQFGALRDEHSRCRGSPCLPRELPRIPDGSRGRSRSGVTPDCCAEQWGPQCQRETLQAGSYPIWPAGSPEPDQA